MYARLVIAALTLALACTPGPDATPAKPTTPAPSKAPTVTDSAPATKAGEAKATTPAAAATPTTTPTITPTTTPTLRVLARRKDTLEIMAHGGRPWLSYEGEPVPLVDGAFTRLPQGSKGMMQCESSEPWLCEVAALAGEPGDPLGVWLTTFAQVERVGDAHHVYHHDGQAWREVTPREQDVLVGHHAPLVKRGGAVLGSLHWAPDPDKEGWASEEELALASDGEPASPELAAYKSQRDAALRKAKGGLVTVAGPATPLPVVPPGLQLRAAVTTADGTLWALATTPWKAGEPVTHRLLAWAPDAVEPKTVAVPDLDRVHEVGLSSSDDRLLLGGCAKADPSEDGGCAEGYLAIGQGEAWERVPIDLPAERKGSREVLGVAREPSGALWIALGRDWVEDEITDVDPVWYRPTGGAWQPVTLPTHEAAFGEPPKPGRVAGWKARGLVWGAGAVWAVLTDSQMRSVVLTSQPGEGGPVELPGANEAGAARTPLPMPEGME